MSDRPRQPTESVRNLITISIPVYNEAENIERLLGRLREVTDKAPQYDYEFLFTDNASDDETFQKLQAEAARDRRIRVLRFSRNFGFQRSILTNFLAAKGDAAVQVDADLQDPPELLLEFLQLWEKGYKVVYGVRRQRIEARWLQMARRMFYRFVDHISEVSVPPGAGDFRLIDRAIIEHLRALNDRAPYLRGYIASLGYPQIGIPYDRSVRVAGQSKFRLPALTKLAIDGICSQSTLPLHYITLTGLAVCVLAVLLSIAAVAVRILSPGTIPAGFTTLLLLAFLSTGVNALFVGIIGEYVGRIFDNVRAHPLTIVETIIDNGAEVDRLRPSQDVSSLPGNGAQACP